MINHKAKIFTGVVLFFSLFLQLGVRIEVTKKSYLMENLRQQALKNDMKLRDLRLNYAWLTSPDNIQDLAEAKLGMVSTRAGVVRRVQ